MPGRPGRSRSARRPLLPLLLGSLLCVAGCKRHPPARHAPHAGRDAAVAAAEAALRGFLPDGRAAQFRGLQVYDQAKADRVAVCGQVSPFPGDPALFVPFVAVETVSATGGVVPPDVVFAGTNVDAADRTYAALVVHCYERGGPGDDPVQSVPPLPPLPNAVPAPDAFPPNASPSNASRPAPSVAGTPAAPGTAPAGTGSDTGSDTAGSQPASGTAETRQNVNLHASPHGAVVRVVPQGTELHVFAAAPGGWLQVGDSAPQGWIHESMLDRH